MSLRTIRRWITATGTNAAAGLAPWLPEAGISALAGGVKRLGPFAPVLGRMVSSNMRAAGVYREGLPKDYFDQVAEHFATAARVLKWRQNPERIRESAGRQVVLDPSVERLRAVAQEGRGAVIAPPHVCNYLLTLPRLNLDVPITVYLRWSEDARRLAMKRAWCEATGLPVILEPASAADPTSRAAACVEALRGGAALVMTPDIAQKREKGVPVRLLGREVYLPTGPASIAMLAGAPIVPVFGRLAGGRQVITAGEVIEVGAESRVEGGRRKALSRAMQQWADGFEAFLRESPECWFLWGDSRWTRVFRGDTKYSRPLEEGDSDSGIRNVELTVPGMRA